jgi:hypothetical protein
MSSENLDLYYNNLLLKQNLTGLLREWLMDRVYD